MNQILNSIYSSRKMRILLLAAMQFILAVIPMAIINGTHGKLDEGVINLGLVAAVATIAFTFFTTEQLSSYVWGLIPCTTGHAVLIALNCAYWNYQPHKIFPFFSILASFLAAMANIYLAHRITQQRRLALA